jgi:hypothetical protein
MSAYFRQLSYRRILLLVLAGSQLFPLPDLPSDPLTPAVPMVCTYPEIAHS